jgi:hypothetical protein
MACRMRQAAPKASVEWTWDPNAADAWELVKDAAAKKTPSPARRP